LRAQCLLADSTKPLTDQHCLQTIGGGLVLTVNISLVNIDGLSDLETIGTFLSIRFNQSISNLCGIRNALTNGVSGEIIIKDNLYNPTVAYIIAGSCSQ